MDLYIVLGVRREATLDDIKRAYKRLARRFHPDINPGDRTAAEQFRQIAAAYETLSDPDRRQRYDISGHAAGAAEPVTFGFEGFDFSISVEGASAPTFGDLFADVFRPPDPDAVPVAPERGPDVHLAMTITLQDALRGGPRSVTFTRHQHCAVCRGMGRLSVAAFRCMSCHGAGTIKSARGHMVFTRPCPRCRGAGMLTDSVCHACAGRQLEARTESLAVIMAAGLGDGARVRVPGRGHAGPSGGDPGDLIITIHVEPHATFRREGDDLHLVVPVAVHEAGLGARIDIQSLDGPARVRVPPGAQSGQRFRLHERGMPALRDGRRGDLVIEIRIVLPKLLDERSKELLREFGRIHAADDVRRDVTASSSERPSS